MLMMLVLLLFLLLLVVVVLVLAVLLVMLVQNRNIVIQNSSFEKVEKLKYLGVTVTYTNDIREEIKLRTNMGNSYYLGKL